MASIFITAWNSLELLLCKINGRLHMADMICRLRTPATTFGSELRSHRIIKWHKVHRCLHKYIFNFLNICCRDREMSEAGVKLYNFMVWKFFLPIYSAYNVVDIKVVAFYLCLCFFELWRYNYISARNQVCRCTDGRLMTLACFVLQVMNKERKHKLGKNSYLEAIQSAQHFGCIDAYCCSVVEDKADSISWINNKRGIRLECNSFSSAIGVEVCNVFVV